MPKKMPNLDKPKVGKNVDKFPGQQKQRRAERELGTACEESRWPSWQLHKRECAAAARWESRETARQDKEAPGCSRTLEMFPR